MNNTRVSKLVHEQSPTGRRHVGRPRKRQRHEQTRGRSKRGWLIPCCCCCWWWCRWWCITIKKLYENTPNNALAFFYKLQSFLIINLINVLYKKTFSVYNVLENFTLLDVLTHCCSGCNDYECKKLRYTSADFIHKLFSLMMVPGPKHVETNILHK
jgi:hypothetical protein